MPKITTVSVPHHGDDLDFPGLHLAIPCLLSLRTGSRLEDDPSANGPPQSLRLQGGWMRIMEVEMSEGSNKKNVGSKG